MKKSIIRFCLLGVLSLFLSSSGVWTSLHAQQEEDKDATPALARHILGSWDIAIPNSPFRILRTYDSGGGVSDAYAFPPFTPTTGPLINSAGHGTWIRTGRNEITVIVKYFQLDPSKNASFQVLDSIGTVTEVVTMLDPDNYASRFTTKVTKPDGTPVLTNPGQTVATRIKFD